MVPVADKATDEPIWFGDGNTGIDLILIDVSHKASVQTRKTAPIIFEDEDKCTLMNGRSAVKQNRKGSRTETATNLHTADKTEFC